jgi:hypothetical protein
MSAAPLCPCNGIALTLTAAPGMKQHCVAVDVGGGHDSSYRKIKQSQSYPASPRPMGETL